MTLTVDDTGKALAGQETPAPSRRRGRDRRAPGNRVNRAAPRHSTMKNVGAITTTGSLALLTMVVLAGEYVLQETPWVALCVVSLLVLISALTLMMGSIEQRLIESRLELMMLNGGARQVDRRAPRAPEA